MVFVAIWGGGGGGGKVRGKERSPLKYATANDSGTWNSTFYNSARPTNIVNIISERKETWTNLNSPLISMLIMDS
jgi:hypothetical protein